MAERKRRRKKVKWRPLRSPLAKVLLLLLVSFLIFSMFHKKEYYAIQDIVNYQVTDSGLAFPVFDEYVLDASLGKKPESQHYDKRVRKGTVVASPDADLLAMTQDAVTVKTKELEGMQKFVPYENTPYETPMLVVEWGKPVDKKDIPKGMMENPQYLKLEAEIAYLSSIVDTKSIQAPFSCIVSPGTYPWDSWFIHGRFDKLPKEAPVLDIRKVEGMSFVNNQHYYLLYYGDGSKFKEGVTYKLTPEGQETILGVCVHIPEEGPVIFRMTEGFDIFYDLKQAKVSVRLDTKDALRLPITALVKKEDTWGVYRADGSGEDQFVEVEVLGSDKEDGSILIRYEEDQRGRLRVHDRILVKPDRKEAE